MTAREYMNQAFQLNQRINTKMEQLESLRTLSEKMSSSYGTEQVSHTRSVTSLEDSVVRIIKAQEELNRQLSEIVRLKVEISALIDRVRNEHYSLILTKRYLRYMPWKQIASDMNYSKRWVLKQHERALQVVEKLLKENDT